MIQDDPTPEEEDEYRRLFSDWACLKNDAHHAWLRLAAFESRNAGRSFHPFTREIVERSLSHDVKPLFPNVLAEP